MKSIFVIILFASIATLSLAQQQTPAVDQRQVNQRARIREGVNSGDLTRGETAVLRKDQRELRRMERRVKADGDVTARERARLQRKANQNSRAIRRQKNDAQTRPGN